MLKNSEDDQANVCDDQRQLQQLRRNGLIVFHLRLYENGGVLAVERVTVITSLDKQRQNRSGCMLRENSVVKSRERRQVRYHRRKEECAVADALTQRHYPWCCP